jgi:hypothetical protein
MYGEKSKIESDKIDNKIINHQATPFGHGDVVENIVVYNEIEKAYRHQRCIISSVNRTKNMIYNYARGNVWEWFVTLTFNKEKIDRYSYADCSKKLREWLNNMRKKYALDLKYLIVPEEHKGDDSECKCKACGHLYINRVYKCPKCECQEKMYAWHFHGLLSNTGKMKFNKAFDKYSALPLLTKSGLQIFNFGNYKLGYSTATAITDTAKASSYITKYITKELAVNTKGHRRYYPSANLDLPCKSYYFLLDNERLEFLKENNKRITFNKQVKVSHGYFTNTVDYIEMEWGKEND